MSSGAQSALWRLDGSSIAFPEAESFTQKTLADADVMGAQLAILNSGKWVWSAAYGYAGKNPERPMTTNTNTWAASVTKGLFGTYCMLLVEQGKLDLDKPVAAQLGRPLDSFEPYRDVATQLVRDPQWSLVTPRMLLSHTSGLSNSVQFSEPDKHMHLHFKPGARFLYSTDGYNLLGFMLEQKFGQPLETQMQDALFGPLGMSRTGMKFRPDFLPDVADRFDAQGHFLSQTRRSPARAGGNAATTAPDLARFFEALFAGKVLKPDTIKTMLTPQIAIRSAHQFQFGEHANDEAQESRDVGLAYGLGWGLLTKTKFGPAFFKEGHGDGAQNYVICFQQSRSCMVLLTNSDNGEHAFRPLLEHLLGDTVTPWEWEGYPAPAAQEARK